MPRRLISQLQRKYGVNKRPQEAIAQKEALAEVGREARNTTDGTLALFKAFYGGKQVASQSADGVCFSVRPRESRPYVVVVGAGLAGLACAYELTQSKQFQVILVEGNKRVGGRVWSVKQNDFENTITETDHTYTTVERGGELVGLNHFLWLHYADEFNLHLDYLEPPTIDPENDSLEEIVGGALLYEYMKLIFQELDEEAEKLDLYDEAKGYKPWDAPDAKRLDGISLDAYLDTVLEKYRNKTLEEVKEKGFSLSSFNFSDFEKAMIATKSDFENNNGLPCKEQSLYFNLVTIGNGNRNLDPCLLQKIHDNIDGIEKAEKARKLSFWEDAELFRCREGNMALAVKFYEHILQDGGQVLLNTTVTEIFTKPNHVKVVVKKDGHEQTLKIPGNKVQKVVLAMPPPVWKHIKISPPLSPSLSPTMGYLVKYLFDVKPKVTKEFRKCDNTTHTQWGMVWEAAKNAVIDGAEKTTQNTLAVFAGGASAFLLANPPDADKLGVEAARRKYVCDNLNLMRPTGMTYTFTPKSIIRDVFMDWPKELLVESGYSCPSLNEVVNLGPQIHGSINGKIYLAGEYACRYKWCGFMEGALISGAGAAKEILKEAERESRRPNPREKLIPALSQFRHPKLNF